MDYFDFFNPKTKTTNMVKSPTYYDFSDSLPQNIDTQGLNRGGMS